MYDLYDLTHVAGWEPCNLDDLGLVSWVVSVQHRSCIASMTTGYDLDHLQEVVICLADQKDLSGRSKVASYIGTAQLTVTALTPCACSCTIRNSMGAVLRPLWRGVVTYTEHTLINAALLKNATETP